MKKALAFVLVVILALGSIPVFADYADTSWYVKSQKTFTLSTPQQLMGLSELSAGGESFNGKTILLDRDIVLNSGDMRVEGARPEHVWTPLKNYAGTKDGQGHAIIGLYATAEINAGFIGTADGCTVKNLSILSSYFATTSGNTVSAFIASGATTGTLTVLDCYTDAKIVSAGYNAGGFVSSVGSAAETEVAGCWFDGEIEIAIRYAAAFVANGEGKMVSVKHCLNTGTVYTSWTDTPMSHIASMIGRNDGSSGVIDCLNLGKISSAQTEAGSNDALGSLFGRCSGSKGAAYVERSAALVGTAPAGQAFGSSAGKLEIEATPDYLEPEQLKGYNAVFNTALDFENVWTVIPDGYPMLRTFAEKVYPSVSVPYFLENQVRVDSDHGLRFLFRMDFLEGFGLDNVKLGSVVIPALAVDDPLDLTLGYETEVNSKTYKALDVPAVNIWDDAGYYADFTAVITDINSDIALKSFYVRPYAIFDLDGSPVTVYGSVASGSLALKAVEYYDNAGSAAKAEFDAVEALKAIYEKFSGFTVREGWVNDGLWEDVPAFSGGELGDEFTVGEDVYDLDCHAYRLTETDLAMFRAYVKSLLDVGFILHADNGADGIDSKCYQATLHNGSVTVNVAFYSQSGETFVTVEKERDLSPYQLPAEFTKIAGKGITLNMLPLKAFGESMVFQLPNGHYLVVDGAQQHNSELTVEFLVKNAPSGTVPVVDGWFFTHAHPDHIFCAMGIGSDPNLVSQIRVEGFYYTWPNDAGVRTESAYADLCSQIAALKAAMPNYRTSDGKVTPQYKLHAGQRLYFCDTEVQILQTQDQLYPADYRGGFNDSSTSYKFITGTQTFLIMGDAHHPVCTGLMSRYGKDTLHVTFFQTLHHTYNDVPDFFRFVAPDYVVVTGNSYSSATGYTWLKNNTKKIFYAGDTIPLPYNG